MAFALWLFLRRKQMVAWNVHGMDWNEKRLPGQIAGRILKRAQEGAIVLLHDSGGGPGAPENTLACLDELCLRIREDLKLPIAPLSFPDWSFRRKLVFRIWENGNTFTPG